MTPPLCPRLCPQKNPSKKKGAGVSANPLDLFVGAAGFEEAQKAAQGRSEPLTPTGPSAQGSPDALTSGGPGAALVAALARAAAAAADAGDLAQARALLEDAARALPQGSAPPIRLVVTPAC